ncbi:MAG TPA: hypothetical protein VFL63_01175, partial [Rhodanobacteraceae bacterium]|nr:hypothetical protein [Rhodanobacteraceae bacterium]
TGFIVTPIANTGQGPRYKLKYGLGTTIKEKGALLPRKLSLNEQQQLQVSLQQEAMQFRQILSSASMDKKEVNEIVIALRKHAGPFPVYAVLQSKLGYCECFDIVGSQKVPNSHRISIADGTMT